ncbi:hypothetical protein [Streptomyces sp. AgN23]|uniref:hypothetical protein n=1 Tax=Streptomyces sp. AgN23 TaxID=1188315 RepID=UPI001B32CFB0|nr:hypothetical protein [Streptomyces sp. AgN23]QTI87230.1 hypothetical protein AS97_39745 [Streptomyces sp. AgN23]QTI90642.1 hypothetical protein AS97_61280 [Streptomyces sp. AgN23]WTB02821.1 hypothetical protein OG546_00190 [Streptomyces antimycoticus]WTB11299.1 hypothetical protein OG546_48935 [Streptomyces antimycoticus]
MRLSPTDIAVRRTWTVELRPQPGGPMLACSQCPPQPHPVAAVSARSVALAHLSQHAHENAVPDHLRTCQCQARGCHWHPRHRGCAGSVLLVLTGDRSGRRWRLTDACAACAAATEQASVVPNILVTAPPAACCARINGPRRPYTPGPQEQVRVREMLTYLGAALPRFSSPTARLLAVQCALRADAGGRVRLPAGLLRSMRLAGYAAPWHELTHAGWLSCLSPTARRTYGGVVAQLLDAAVLDQAPPRRARVRAAHWALHPIPLAATREAPPAVQLTTLTLAVHTSGRSGSVEVDLLTRLCGLSLGQVEELLDRLVRARLLDGWQRFAEAGELRWHLPPEPPPDA